VIAALAVMMFLVPQQPRPDSATRPPVIVQRARLDARAPVNFRVLIVPDTVYVGQQAIYQLGVFLDNSIKDRLRRMEANAPEMPGVMAYEPPAPSGSFPSRTAGGHRYEVHVYQGPIFPLSAGRLTIPPAHLVYALPLSYSFFSREESYDVRTDSAVLIVREPPLPGRPADWTGTVGEVHLNARLDTSAARVGDPVLLTVSVSGRGNVKLFARPALSISWARIVPAGERVTLSADSLDIHGTKEFDWLLTPTVAGRLVLPVIRYSYFDPASARYAVATTGGLVLHALPGMLVADSVPTGPRWAVRSTYRGALARPPYGAPSFWVVMLLAPIPALVLFASRWPRRAPRATSPGRALSVQIRTAPGDVRAVRRAFLSAVADRIRVPATQLAEPRALERAARRAGTSPETAAHAAALLDEMNAAAFSAQPKPVRDVSRRAEALYRRVDKEARTFRARIASPVVIFLLVTFLTARAAAVAPDTDGTQFARGVQAYDQGRFGVAEGEFLALARRVPRAADAWANLGTAAYAAADTAHAVIGWQRALRLEPLAVDARDRLEYIGAAPGSGVAAVPAIPVVPLALLAAALWLGGWLLLAWCLARHRARGRLALIAGTLGAAIALAGAAAVLDARLAARDLGVLTRETPLRLLPSLGAQARATMHAGDMARITNRSGVWVHVEADGDKAGWMEAAALTSIARD